MSAVLLTRLKIVDLAAWTALDAGRRLLPPGHSLAKLVREELYLFEAEPGSPAAGFEGVLEHAIRSSNFFVNPNKEQFRFLTSEERGAALAAPAGAWGLLTRPRDDARDEGLRIRLVREHPLTGLGAIRRARIWWLWTSGPAGGTAWDACALALGPVTARGHGLLVNPHSETHLVLTDSTPWRSIEAFLTQPAPAMGAAA